MPLYESDTNAQSHMPTLTPASPPMNLSDAPTDEDDPPPPPECYSPGSEGRRLLYEREQQQDLNTRTERAYLRRAANHPNWTNGHTCDFCASLYPLEQFPGDGLYYCRRCLSYQPESPPMLGGNLTPVASPPAPSPEYSPGPYEVQSDASDSYSPGSEGRRLLRAQEEDSDDDLDGY
jgi:hypothetical protein